MYQFRLDEHKVHRSVFHSLRMQLAWIVTAALVLPATAFIAVQGFEAMDRPATLFSAGLSVAASSATLLVLRQVGSILGIALSRWVLPVYFTAFGCLAGLFFLVRLPYSTILLGLSFAFSVLGFFALTSLMARHRRATCYVIPRGRAAKIDFASSLRTIMLDHPRMPASKRAVVVADMHADLGDEWERFLTEAALQGHPIYHIAQLREAMTGQVQFDHLSENSFGALIPTLTYNKLKRLIDLVCAIVVLPILLPLLALVGIAIKLDSPGPAFFVQRRMGYRGKFFRMIKFRTMTVTENGENRIASVTQHNDQRVTRIGRLLRPTRIDELPQVFNILRGEMSWIGPRPEAVSLSSEYASKIANYRYRHLVRPGLSGWAQVNQGHVTSVEDVQAKLCYDFYYVKNVSLWLDIVIALRTLNVIVTGFGAK